MHMARIVVSLLEGLRLDSRALQRAHAFAHDSAVDCGECVQVGRTGRPLDSYLEWGLTFGHRLRERTFDL